jgi:hypothetical protein
MTKKSWTEFRSDIERVISEFNLSGILRSVNITQIENIDRNFMTFFVRREKQSRNFCGWIWEYLKDENVWGQHSPDYRKTSEILKYTVENTDEDLYIIFTESYREKTKFWYYEGKISGMITVIEETNGIDEFYIFSKKFTWLTGQNHHDVIFATGSVKTERLKKGFEIYG